MAAFSGAGSSDGPNLIAEIASNLLGVDQVAQDHAVVSTTDEPQCRRLHISTPLGSSSPRRSWIAAHGGARRYRARLGSAWKGQERSPPQGGPTLPDDFGHQ